MHRKNPGLVTFLLGARVTSKAAETTEVIHLCIQEGHFGMIWTKIGWRNGEGGERCVFVRERERERLLGSTIEEMLLLMMMLMMIMIMVMIYDYDDDWGIIDGRWWCRWWWRKVLQDFGWRGSQYMNRSKAGKVHQLLIAWKLNLWPLRCRNFLKHWDGWMDEWMDGCLPDRRLPLEVKSFCSESCWWMWSFGLENCLGSGRWCSTC